MHSSSARRLCRPETLRRWQMVVGLYRPRRAWAPGDEHRNDAQRGIDPGARQGRQYHAGETALILAEPAGKDSMGQVIWLNIRKIVLRGFFETNA